MSSEKSTEEVRNRREELQSLWSLPSVAQFVSLYRFAFKLPEIEIEELEDGLLEENDVGGKVLQELLVALLKGIQPTRGINASNLEEHLQKQIRKFWKLEKKEDYPFSEETTFSQIDIASKVDILHYLCCMRVDRPDALEAMKSMDAAALRVPDPLGMDDQGNQYWYVLGTKLYKEEPLREKRNWQEEWNYQKDKSFNRRGRGRPRKAKLRKSDGESDDIEDVNSTKNGSYMNITEKSNWSTVCNTMEDWVEFAEKFKNSKSKNEKALFQTVTEDFLADLNDMFQEKERKLQQKLRELIPRSAITRRETRGQKRIKTLQSTQLNGCDAETAHREYVARDRARRLEERNRRLSQSAERFQTRSRKQKYREEDEEDYDEEDDIQENISTESAHTSDSDDYRKEYTPVIIGENSDLKSQVLKVLTEIKLRKDSWPFLYPVDENTAPSYYEIITDPMDLSTMTSKLLAEDYQTLGHIVEDFQKMVENCKVYNGENSEWANMAMKLWNAFKMGISRIGNPSDLLTPYTSSRSESTLSRMTEFPKQAESKSKDLKLKRSTDSQDQKKKKKTKTQHMEALEILSKESELAIERSQRDDIDGPQSKQYSLYSDLKIIPINSHPSSLIDKFSDSSNQEVDDLDSSNASASSYVDQGSSSSTSDPPNNSEKAPQDKSNKVPNVHYLAQNEDSSDLSDFIDKNNTKGFNILSDGEGNNPNVLSDSNATDLQSVPRRKASSDNSPQGRARNLKTSSSNIDGLVHGVPTVLEDCNNDNISSLMSGLSRETFYSMDGQRIPPVNESVASHSSLNPSDKLYPRRSPQNIPIGTNNSNTVSRTSPLLQESFNVQGLNSSGQCNEVTTVDASALGISSNLSFFRKQSEVNFSPGTVGVSQAPLVQNTIQSVENFPQVQLNPFAKTSPKRKPRYSPTFISQQLMQNSLYNQPTTNNQNQEFQGISQYQVQKSNVELASAPNNVATFTTHMSSQQPSTNNSVSMHVPTQYSKMFPNPGQMVLKPATEQNKFPTMKVALPPSTGELLVVPGDPASSSLTFHLFAQPHSNPSQPIQSRMQVFPDGTVQHQSNQAVENGTENQYATKIKGPSREDTIQRLPKRKSPVRDLQQSMATTTATTVPYQISSTSIPSSSVSSSLPYVSSPMVTTYSNLNPTVIRPNAMRHLSPTHTNVTYSSGSVVQTIDNMRTSNPFLQTSTPYQNLSSTTVPSAFPSYSYRFASASNGNTATTTTNSSNAVKPPRVSLQKVYIPNVPSQLNQNAVMQNGNGTILQNGQFILMPPTKETAKRSPNGDQNQRMQMPESNMAKTLTESCAPASFYPGASNIFFQGASGSSSQMYTQVLPSQLPPYANTPYYIVADPNSLQNPQRYPVMNMQPIPFPNR